MPDDKSKQGKQDDIRIDANDKSEVEYVHKQFPKFSHDEIVAAIRAKGPMRQNVIDYLKSVKK